MSAKTATIAAIFAQERDTRGMSSLQSRMTLPERALLPGTRKLAER